MASVIQKNGAWLMRWNVVDTTGKRVRRSRMSEATNRKAALAEANRIEAQQQAEAPVTGGQMRLLDFAATRWLPHQRAHCRPRTAATDEARIRRVAEILDNPRLESITASDFDALTVMMISTGYAALYARHHFSALRTALRQARRWGLIAGRPWEDARAPVAPRSRPKVATMDESRKLSAYVRARNRPVVAAYVDFLAGTGARPGEALALKWDRVDLLRGEVTLDRSVECHMPGHYRLAEAVKTGRGRTVRITGALIAILTDLAAWHDDLAQKSGGRWPARPDGLVFPSTMGDLWNPDAAARVIRRAADGAKVTGGSYSRRHGMATELLLAGAPVSLVSARLGHASAKMTLDVYAHLLPGAEEQVLDILEAKGL